MGDMVEVLRKELRDTVDRLKLLENAESRLTADLIDTLKAQLAAKEARIKELEEQLQAEKNMR